MSPKSPFRQWLLVTSYSLHLLLALLLLRCSWSEARGKDRNQPHPFKGVLKPYEPGPFDISLSASDESKLESGQPVMKQTLPSKEDPEAGGGAICVQDVMAPPSLVWEQILDLNGYKGKVPKVLTSQNYYTGKDGDGSERIKTKMVLGVLPGYSVRFVLNAVIEQIPAAAAHVCTNA
jgi:hypothetical protein